MSLFKKRAYINVMRARIRSPPQARPGLACVSPVVLLIPRRPKTDPGTNCRFGPSTGVCTISAGEACAISGVKTPCPAKKNVCRPTACWEDAAQSHSAQSTVAPRHTKQVLAYRMHTQKQARSSHKWRPCHMDLPTQYVAPDCGWCSLFEPPYPSERVRSKHDWGLFGVGSL